MSVNGSELSEGNVYAPPQAELTPAIPVQQLPPFYVVSITKVVLLSIATLGMYSLYWFWNHWKRHKIDKKLSLWPVPRAIFAIFFAHSLNREIDYRLQRNRSNYRWSPGAWATLYVVSVILMRVISRIPETMLSANLSFVLILLPLAGQIMALVRAQRAANLACGDPQALQNRRLTVANWFWLVLGGLFWLLIVVGNLLIALGPTVTVDLPAN
ncbi:DUF4234 domain-containing protein [Stenotrophomonas sp.]|uniref:DUF4234 domain-containing protein n=1 Tax=Stenotrophomonas sp. TaxID=69392 RepID=UPI0028A634A6|nr:DUF4234 domain-containing protein [Stenotrophomonas sp.]